MTEPPRPDNDKANPATIAAIARKAGVSSMTVSRVLRNERYVSEATKTKVLAVAEAMHYRPNPMVAALMATVRGESLHSRQTVLAYLTTGPSKGNWKGNICYRSFHEGAATHAELRGYRLEEFWLDEENMDPRRMSQILYTQGIIGMIVAPLGRPCQEMAMEWSKFAPVAIGYSLPLPGIFRVAHNHYASMWMALDNLYHLGYKRIGLAVSRFDDARVHYHWSAAYLAYHHHHQIPPPPTMHQPEQSGWPDIKSWLNEEKIDVVMATDGNIGWLLEDWNYKVPEEIGFAHLDLLSDSFAGIDQKPKSVGAAAVDLVISMINHNEFGLSLWPHEILLPGEWVQGPTVMDRSGAAG